MPLSRKKACQGCSKSKLRCNRAFPTCSRCGERGLSCVYDGAGRRSGPYQPPTTAPLEDAHSAFNQSLRSRFVGLHQVQREHPATSSSMGISDFTNQFMDWGDSDMQSTSNLHPATTTTVSSPKGFNFNTVQDTPSWFPSSLNDTQESNQLDQQLATPSSPTQSTLVVIPNEDDSGNETTALAQRPFARGTILSSIILGQLTSYPKMLIQGDLLPPFIHPPCFRDERLAPECSDKGYHVCLPEDLAICQTLVRGFYERTDKSVEFVWKAIYAETERVKKEVSFDIGY